jgi:hypothetical protein
MKYVVIIEGTTVANVIVTHDNAALGPNEVDVTDIPDRPGPGWLRIGAGFSAPVPPVTAVPAWRTTLEAWLAANPNGGALTVTETLALVQAVLGT